MPIKEQNLEKTAYTLLYPGVKRNSKECLKVYWGRNFVIFFYLIVFSNSLLEHLNHLDIVFEYFLSLNYT